VPDTVAVARELAGLRARLAGAAQRSLTSRRGALADGRAWLADAARTGLARRRERLGTLADRLDALSPLGALRRGFAVPLGADGRILRGRDAFTPGDPVRLRVIDGTVALRTESVEPAEEVP
jgi:exodeoxyribonuclease VII large subunit